MSPRLPLAFLFALICAPAFAAEPPPAAAGDVPDVEDAPAAEPAPPPHAEKSASKKSVDLQDIRAFTAVYNLVKQAYVEDVDDHRLMQQAIRGLLSGLDPHSEYLGKEQIENLTEDTTGSYDGLGIEVVQVDGVLRVIAPIDDSPAERAGIKAGDTIVQIDGKPVQSDDLDGAIAHLRGKPGTEITLNVLHEKQSTPVDIKLRREAIKVASVRARLLEPGYAYLRISQFQADTGVQLRKRIERMQADNKAPLRGAILDLRSNPGGLVTSAVEVSDAFLDDGVIVTTKGRLKDSDLSFRATPGDLLKGAPLVVLVDNGTASAAEIVAGALKDNHRALLMGRRTFGKGSVQTVLPLDAEHAVKLTTARYYTPSGISIQAAGIQPDIALADLALTQRDSAPTPAIGERDLRNHLKGADEGDGSVVTPSAADRDVEKDYALNEALNALKALALRNKPAAAPVESKG
ncbi:S41 family peptidase [Dokdonella sp.]|uniref:S41 family peptidase n=1 Tax=Dokdonella sp. TaxID=2291710 RepID=UPI001B0AFEFC|nr:S41 family peptidase [Dokdonella sp.]MBO9664464.1 S41 family peptidase [Dokdonella sp.]